MTSLTMPARDVGAAAERGSHYVGFSPCSAACPVSSGLSDRSSSCQPRCCEEPESLPLAIGINEAGFSLLLPLAADLRPPSRDPTPSKGRECFLSGRAFSAQITTCCVDCGLNALKTTTGSGPSPAVKVVGKVSAAQGRSGLPPLPRLAVTSCRGATARGMALQSSPTAVHFSGQGSTASSSGDAAGWCARGSAGVEPASFRGSLFAACLDSGEK